MSKSAIWQSEPASSDPEKFSLILGGPLYQLLIRTHLIDPPLRLLQRRIISAIVITWLPLLVLSALEGNLYSGTSVPFFMDLGTLRFLIILPLMIYSELIVHQRLRTLIEQFVERGLIAPEDHDRFKGIIARAMKLRNSIIVEICLILISYTAGHLAWNKFGSLHTATWYTVSQDGVFALSYAGTWLAFVSLPIIRFLLLRWYFRLFIWYLVLWRISRLPLQLNALHPDRAGGLGFMGRSITAFTPFLLAQSGFLAAQIGNEIWHEGKSLPQHQMLIMAFIAYLLLSVLLPLACFVPRLAAAKSASLRELGKFASQYVNEFRDKWLNPSNKPEDPLLGSSDIQSLADLSNSFEVMRTMRLVPFDKIAVIRLVVILLMPMLPLLLTMISIEEAIERLIKLLM